MSVHFKNSPLIVSDMTGKLQGLRALNTNPLTNDFCKRCSTVSGTICHECYSMRMLSTYRKMCVPAYQKNSETLSSELLEWTRVPDLKRFELFRINAHGELINPVHALNVYMIIENNPGTFFGFWTKRSDIINRIRRPHPRNMNLVYSTPRVNCPSPRVPRGFDKVFSVYTRKYAEEHGVKINCKGSCATCRLCYTRNKTTHINEIIKGD